MSVSDNEIDFLMAALGVTDGSLMDLRKQYFERRENGTLPIFDSADQTNLDDLVALIGTGTIAAQRGEKIELDGTASSYDLTHDVGRKVSLQYFTSSDEQAMVATKHLSDTQIRVSAQVLLDGYVILH